ncbi:MAG: DUF3160 domain-containing protein [Armatimonadetes bacterium]|nr:DUF3160 domain-containing protein [Armatimonadota bacterium]
MYVAALTVLATIGCAEPTFGPPANLEALRGEASLDEPALARLVEQGLVVLPATDGPHLQALYYHLEGSGLPVYITADAMLYLWYEAHREALMSLEAQTLFPQTRDFVAGLLDATEARRAAQDLPELRANAITLAVARRLLDEVWVPPGDLAPEVEAEVGLVLEHRQMGRYPADDYTQYTVRGHYAEDPDLAAYFRGTKYLARQYLPVLAPDDPEGARVGLRRAVWLALALREGPGLRARHDEIAGLRVRLAGPADTIGLDQLLGACEAVWGEGWGVERLADLSALQAELAADRYPATRITNRAVPSPGRLPPKNVAVLGEHWLPDSELFQRTIDPLIRGRALPTGLEVAAALGSETAVAKLVPDAHAPPQVVEVVREFGPQMRGPGVYGAWLDTLRELFARPESLPAFAQAPAYEEKQINACLTSWAQQRHNYILYGAQPYSTLGVGPEAPGLVEPLPGFWGQYTAMCGQLAEELESRGVKGRAATVLRLLETKAERFRRCAEDQLAGRDISWAADDITRFGTWMGTTIYEDPRVIADVCTDAQLGEILHAGSGPFREIIVLLERDTGWLGAVGYVGSYYEIIEPDRKRLTDEEWAARFDDPYDAPEQPAWLGALGTPASAEQARARDEMAALSRALKADLASGTVAIEGFVQAHQYIARAPEAIVLLAEHLHAAGQDDEALRVAERARTMYGCDARDRALGLIGRITREREYEAKREQARREFERALAVTDPREGLSQTEEVERQNRRAEVLIAEAQGQGADSEWQRRYSRDAPALLRRLLTECPRSGYVPWAELALVLTEWEGFYGSPEWGAPPRALTQGLRDGFRQVAQRYPNSAVGLAARVGAADMLYWQAEYREAYTELRPLLDLKPPDPEPYPLAAQRVPKRYESLSLTAGDLAEDLLQQLLPQACLERDLPLVRELVELAETHDVLDRIGTPLRPVLDYLAGEPDEAVADFLAGLALGEGFRSPGEPDPEVLRAALSGIADRFAQSKVAPAALWQALIAADLVAPGPGDRSPADASCARLVRDYPHSPEALYAQAVGPFRLADEGEVRAAERRLKALRRDAACDAYVGALVARYGDEDDRRYLEESARRQRAGLREKWGTWIREARLGEKDLEALDYEQALVAELQRRLPERELDIALHALEGRPHPYLDREEIEVLGRHLDDPRAREAYWQTGRWECLLTLVSAGPEGTHFDEAVAKLAGWLDSNEYRGGNGPARARGSRDLSRALESLRTGADGYRGTPAEVMGWEIAAKLCLLAERPEQATEVLREALEEVGEGRLLRERLTALQQEAEAVVESKRRGVDPGAYRPAGP